MSSGSGDVDTNRDVHDIDIIIGCLTFQLRYEQFMVVSPASASLTLFHTSPATIPAIANLRVSYTIRRTLHVPIIIEWSNDNHDDDFMDMCV